MASVDLQAFSSAARGLDAMSFFVVFLYSSKAAAMIVSKFVEEGDGTWDIVILEGDWIDA